MKDYFFCYSTRVSDWLTFKGIRYICVAQEPKTKKLFSLYEINEELNEALQEYKQQSK